VDEIYIATSLAYGMTLQYPQSKDDKDKMLSDQYTHSAIFSHLRSQRLVNGSTGSTSSSSTPGPTLETCCEQPVRRQCPQVYDLHSNLIFMVSGLKGNTYEDKLREMGMLTLEERRHQADMAQTFKILRGVDMVESDNWVQMMDQAGRATRSTDDPLNVRLKAARLEVRKNFFSSRVTENWNYNLSHVKNVKTVSGFKRSYKNHREGKRFGGKMERWSTSHEEDTPREVPVGLL
jgi:hypothetical protein